MSSTRQLLAEVTDLSSLKWEPDPVWASGSVVVELDIAKIDADWSKDAKSTYIGKGGTHNPKRGCYQGFVDFLGSGETIKMPYIYYNDWTQCIQFGNGRHRFAVLRDMGLKKIPALVPAEQVDFFRQNFS